MRSIKLLLFLLFLGVILLSSCTKIKDLINPPTPREVYSREFNEDNAQFIIWQKAYEQSFEDSLVMVLPYQESGVFYQDNIDAYSYEVDLEKGEIFNFEVIADSLNSRIFIDFFRQSDDSLQSYDIITQNDPTERNVRFNVSESGTYRIIVQPALETDTPFILNSYIIPSYLFPVAGHSSSAIKSFWGAPRDAGRRRHEGIDIFAPRGTPVIAATGGRIRYTGERGLGGKQVWLRTDFLGGNSLYYAHLDSIADVSGRVEEGDTLGFIGNTGNAITTPPHLHFGIYTRSGAVNPLPFVYESNRPEMPSSIGYPNRQELIVNSAVANLRLAASLDGKKVGEAERGDTLQVLGATEDWRHIKTVNNLEAFIHRSLVE